MAAKPTKAEGREASTQPEKVEDIWKKEAGTSILGRRNFKLECRRGKELETFNFNGLCTTFSWSETGPLMSGSVNLSMPRGKHILDIQEGDLVVCLVSNTPDSKDGWKTVWRQRVSSIDENAMGGEVTLGLVDELHRLMESEADFNFRKDHAHPKGWYCHQIAKAVCDEYGVPIGKLKKGKHLIKRLSKKGVSPLDIIVAAYAREKHFSAEKVVVKFSSGALNVLPLHYSKFLYEFAGTLTGATLTGRARKNFATVLQVTATDSQKKSKKQKWTLEVKSKKLLDRFGRIVKKLVLGDVESKDDARKEALRHMAEIAEPKRDISISHPGIPSVGRGDACKISLPSYGYKEEVLFIKEATHTVAPGSYEMQLTLSYDDPVKDAQKEKECAEKCKKAKENNKPAPKDCNCPESKKEKKKAKKTEGRENEEEGTAKKRANSTNPGGEKAEPKHP